MEEKNLRISLMLISKIPFSVLFISYLYGVFVQNDSYTFKRGNTEWVVFSDIKKTGLKLVHSKVNVVEEESILYSDSLINNFLTHRFQNRVQPWEGVKGCPGILDSWDEYHRQVTLYYDGDRGEDIIYFQYIHKNAIKNHPNWKEKWVLISGGCSNYWSAGVGLTSKEVINFGVN